MKLKHALTISAGLFCLALAGFISSCTKEEADSSKEILSFTLKKPNGFDFASGKLVVEFKDHEIHAYLPYDTSMNPLIPVFTITGKSVTPASGVPQDFKQPVTYTDTAEDGSTAQYVVTVGLPPIVYAGNSNGNFYALNALNGALIWKFTSSASFAYSGASLGNGTIYVGGIDNNVYAFNALTGAVKWQQSIATTGIESDAVYADGVVYVGTNDDYLYALDANTGQVLWSFLAGANVSSSPTVANGVVYFGSADSKLYALYASTGQLKWSFLTGGMINGSEPLLDSGVVYVGSRDSYLYAIRADSGTMLWQYYAQGISLEMSSPVISKGIVYTGSWINIQTMEHGSLHALDASSGQQVWESLANEAPVSDPSVAEGRLVISSSSKVYAVDALHGVLLWEKTIYPNAASPVIFNGVVYVGGGGTNYFYALDVMTGAERWKYNITGIMTSDPLVVSSEVGSPWYGW